MKNMTLLRIIPILPFAFAGSVFPAHAQGPSTATQSASTGSVAPSPADTMVTVSFGGFVDSYYAYDFGRPANFDRPFTTQAARHNEFNVNLGYIEAKVSGPRLRGRLALQAGTSVQSNYAGEPAIGAVSGPSLSRFIQEAVAGYQIKPSLWIDGGIFFSHIGEEGFISRDNLTYTRSLSADFTPYYESGVKLTWQATSKLTALVTVVNGWQNISENNQDKAVGARFDYARSPSTTLSYYDFIGKLQMTPLVGVSGRVERYQDPDQVIVATGTPGGFKATTASLGVDVSPNGPTRVLWRNELRGTWAGDPVFPDRSAATGTSTGNALLVTSLALTF